MSVVEDAQCEVGQIDHHIVGAEVVRHPAPALHVGEHHVGRRPVGRAAIDRVDGLLRQQTGWADLVFLLELLDRLGEFFVVSRTVAAQAEPFAQLRHATILPADLGS